MELESLNATFVIDTFLLLLIGIGPKIALVPFLETTGQMPEATQRRVLRKMLTTAATVAVLLLILGGLLTRLLHFSPGALGVASGIILFIIAVTMVLGPRDGNGDSHPAEVLACRPVVVHVPAGDHRDHGPWRGQSHGVVPAVVDARRSRQAG